MGYSLSQITELLLKADKTLYRLGSIAYDDMFSEDSELLDYERDIIFLYEKSVSWAKDNHLGEIILDKTCERLSVKVNLYDYGSLTPIYSDSVTSITISTTNIFALKATRLTINNITYDLSEDRTWDLIAGTGYAANIGNASATSFTVTHNLGTKDLIVLLYDNDTYEQVYTNISMTSTSAVTVIFAVAPALDAYRIVIKK